VRFLATETNYALLNYLSSLREKKKRFRTLQKRNNLKQKYKPETNEEPKKDITSIQYVMDRVGKLRPTKKTTLINSLKAMYQFQGGISEEDQETIIKDLEKQKFLKIDQNNKVKYFDKN
jgi:hypothetical protein